MRGAAALAYGTASAGVSGGSTASSMMSVLGFTLRRLTRRFNYCGGTIRRALLIGTAAHVLERREHMCPSHADTPDMRRSRLRCGRAGFLILIGMQGRH